MASRLFRSQPYLDEPEAEVTRCSSRWSNTWPCFGMSLLYAHAKTCTESWPGCTITRPAELFLQKASTLHDFVFSFWQHIYGRDPAAPDQRYRGIRTRNLPQQPAAKREALGNDDQNRSRMRWLCSRGEGEYNVSKLCLNPCFQENILQQCRAP